MASSINRFILLHILINYVHLCFNNFVKNDILLHLQFEFEISPRKYDTYIYGRVYK